MNNKVNYTMIGFSVLVGFVMMFAFSYWLLKPSKELEIKKYVINFNESVLGLNIDSAVKYRGIKVGKVTKLMINPKNTEQVQVVIDILKTTPIKSSTVAQLTSQGITGLSYINLSLGDNNAPMLEAKDGEPYPIIKTTPSFFSNVESSFGSVTANLSSTLDKTSKLLNNENQKQFALLLKNSASVMAKMDRLLDDEMINNIHQSARNINSSTKKVDDMLPNIDKFLLHSTNWESKISTSFGSIMTSYLGIRSAMDEIKRAISSGEFNVKKIAGGIVPTLNETMVQMQNMLIGFDSLLNRYKRSPADLLYKQEEMKKGPGER